MTEDATAPTIIPRDQHPISRQQISENALKVLHRLIEAGHQAYLVGGGVRDLLLGQEPKDFDVATSARPEEVRELFRNSRLIGRRFRLAHVRYGREIIEVSTFRSRLGSDGEGADEDNELFEEAARADEELLREADNGDSTDDQSLTDAAAADADDEPVPPEPAGRGRRRRREEPPPEEAVLSEGGMILRDNVYGSLAEDALRRDLTINALYYTPDDRTVHDYANGMADIEARLIRLIGNPEQRYREDPVRMLRTIRFAAKLNFEIEPATAAPIKDLGKLLLDIPAARLFDELTKVLLCGQSERAWKLLLEHDLLQWLLPGTEASLDPQTERLIEFAMENTDQRISAGKPVTPGFQYAVLLWPPLEDETTRLLANGADPGEAFNAAADEVFSEQIERTAIPRRFSTFAREVWELQPRLMKRQATRVARLVDHPRFRAAYDFLLLREAAGEDIAEIVDWWTRFQDVSGKERATMLDELRPNKRGNNRNRGGHGQQGNGRPTMVGPMDSHLPADDLPQSQLVDGNRAPGRGSSDDGAASGNSASGNTGNTSSGGSSGGGRGNNRNRGGRSSGQGQAGGGQGNGNRQGSSSGRGRGGSGGNSGGAGNSNRRRKGRPQNDGPRDAAQDGNQATDAPRKSADGPAPGQQSGNDGGKAEAGPNSSAGSGSNAGGGNSGSKRRRNRRRRRGPAARSGGGGGSGGGSSGGNEGGGGGSAPSGGS